MTRVLPPLVLMLIVVLTPLLAGCAGSARSTRAGAEPENIVTYSREELVTIRGVLTLPESTNRERARVDVRYDNGVLAIRMVPDERGVYQTRQLFPDETYIVSAEFAMGEGGPWHFPTERVVAEPGGVYRVDLGPFAGDAGLDVTVDVDTQPYMFALYDEDTPAPDGRLAFQKWFEEGVGKRTPLYLRLEAGDDAWQEPTLPPGRYRAVVVANDWEPGDPDAEPVSCLVELRAGARTALHIGERCTALVER